MRVGHGDLIFFGLFYVTENTRIMSLGVLVFLQIFQRDFSYEKTTVYTATFVAGG